jgi:hypothetical protein
MLKIPLAFIIPFLMGNLSVLGAGNPPPKEKKPLEHDLKQTLKTAEGEANQALNAVDRGVHKAIRAVNESLQEHKKPEPSQENGKTDRR